MKLEKSNPKEIEKTIAIVLGGVLLLMPISFLLQYFGMLDDVGVSIGEIVLVCGSVVLLLFDVFYFKFKENRYIAISDVALLLFFISILISTFGAKDLGLALSGHYLAGESTYVMCAYIVVIFNATIICRNNNRNMVLYSLVVLGIIQFVMGVLQAIIKPEFIADITEYVGTLFSEHRAMGTMKNPNPYGSVMVALTGVEMGFVYLSKSRIKLLLHLILLGIFAFCVFLSGTRGAWVGLFSSCLIMGGVLLRAKIKYNRNINYKKIGGVVACLIFAGVMFVCLSKDTLNETVDRVENDIANSKMGEERLEIWKQAVDRYVVKYPISGVGVSNVCFILGVDFSNDTGEAGVRGLVTDVHNRYLNLLCTQGIIGLLAYLLILGCAFVNVISKLNDNDDKYNGMLGLMISFCGYCVADVFCIGMSYSVPVFCVICGMMLPRESVKLKERVKRRSGDIPV